MKHVHTFACPVFALQNALASGKLLLRWSPRARLGLNLGPLPMQGMFTWFRIPHHAPGRLFEGVACPSASGRDPTRAKNQKSTT
jgi:hypothetical protein